MTAGLYLFKKWLLNAGLLHAESEVFNVIVSTSNESSTNNTALGQTCGGFSIPIAWHKRNC